MLPTNTANPQTAGASQIATWEFKRGWEQFRFQMELDPGDPTEKAILDFYNARVFYEPEVAGLMTSVLKAGDVVIDVGANCGFFTVLAATLTGPRGHVMAFEPAATCVTRMRGNLDRNRLTNVNIIDRVAAAQSGETKFYLNSDNSGGNALWDPGEWPGNAKSCANPMPVSVAATTIDAEYQQHTLPIPKLIKIDTEGAEQRVLEGAVNLLANCKVPFIVVELHEFALAKLGCTQQSSARPHGRHGLLDLRTLLFQFTSEIHPAGRANAQLGHHQHSFQHTEKCRRILADRDDRSANLVLTETARAPERYANSMTISLVCPAVACQVS